MTTKYISNELDFRLIKNNCNQHIKEINFNEAKIFIINSISLIKYKDFCDLYSRIFDHQIDINESDIEIVEGDEILIGDIQSGKLILSDKGEFFKDYPDFKSIDENQIKWYIVTIS